MTLRSLLSSFVLSPLLSRYHPSYYLRSHHHSLSSFVLSSHSSITPIILRLISAALDAIILRLNISSASPHPIILRIIFVLIITRYHPSSYLLTLRRYHPSTHPSSFHDHLHPSVDAIYHPMNLSFRSTISSTLVFDTTKRIIHIS